MCDSIRKQIARILEQTLAGANTQRATAEHASAIQDRLDRLERAGSPLCHADTQALVHDKLTPTHAMRIVRAWHEGFRDPEKASSCARIVAMLGALGRGKTMAGLWLIAAEGGVYVTANDLRTRLLSGQWRDADWSERVLRSRVVVLDDVGIEPGDDAGSSAMFELVNRRAGCTGGLTLITSNLTQSEFSQRYGDRVVDRVQYCGHFVEAKGANLRRQSGGTSQGGAPQPATSF
jgi:hypothetical protein